MFLHASVILFTRGGMVSQHALQVVSQHALQQVSRGGGWYPSMPCRFPGPHPGGKLRGLAWGGFSRHTPGVCVSRPKSRGVSPGPHPGGCIPACTEADPPPPTATAAGGTHPTGMHSCYLLFFHFIYFSLSSGKQRTHK